MEEKTGTHTFHVLDEDTGKRIDVYLSEKIEELTRSHIQKLIADNCVCVNDISVRANYRLRFEDIVTISVPADKDTETEPENIPLDIVYEDNDLLVVNKPKGMVVHPANGHNTGTLVNALLYHCADSLSGINGMKRPGIVHRIDMNTTGLLVVCKNDYTHTRLAEQLKEHSITRKYRAIVLGRITEDGTVHAPIGRDPADRLKMSTRARVSRDAITHYHILETFSQYTYIECTLETGRTHQIRVHMASIGHPLLGDDVYGPSRSPFKLTGQTLHAMVLGFVHPRTGKYMEFQAPLPEYFEHLLKILR